jgi:outer membrane protein assembly factor BamA
VCHAAEDDWRRYQGWEVAAFRVEGAPAALAGDLQRGLAFTGEWKLLRGRTRPEFSARTLAEDLARIRLFMASHGYPAARPEPVVVPDPEKRQLALTIRVDPGDPVRIGAITFTGWPEGVATPDTARADIVAVGDIVSDELVAMGLSGLRSYLRNQGFAEVTVSSALRPLSRGRVTLDFTVAAGERYRIVDVQVVGCSDDLTPLALRVIDIAPGTEYSEKRINDAALDLRLTQLFRQVVLETKPVGPGELRVTARLENARMRNWDASIGTWQDNPWRVTTDWTDRNAFKRGVGYVVRGSYATHEVMGGVGVFWLGWLSPRARTQVGATYIEQDEDAYRSQEYRVALVQSFRPRGRDILNVGTALSENRIDERVPDASGTPESQGLLWEFYTDRKWDRTDDPIFPTDGGYLKVALTTSEPWIVSEVPYSAIQIDAALFRPLRDGLVVSGRVRAGVARSMKSDQEVIANRRYHAGGYNSHRGYGRRRLGPRDGEGNPRGGEGVFLLSGELRLPVYRSLEGGVFIDSGNVWQVLEYVSPGFFPVACGLTLGLRSPIGPVRIGWARNIADLVPGEPRNLWHFGIGYPW